MEAKWKSSFLFPGKITGMFVSSTRCVKICRCVYPNKLQVNSRELDILNKHEF